MREIKFRGKRIDDGEWVYGYYWHNEKYDEHIIFDQRKCHEVDFETVGQYTGIEDTNEKEVYEGDIVKQHYFYEGLHPQTLGVEEREAEIIGVVKIDGCGTYTETADGSKYYWTAYLECESEQLEVIGNIFENSGMLEGDQNENGQYGE